jgi:diaminohydroxyphosphoribosylaminopyrimidine deaminase/5-amino-6-(5-phosphoribosylamino)uracil reductase
MTSQTLPRPSVTLKLATSLDGMIATRTGASKWITGDESRAMVHDMRARHDCILTGIGTVLADNPKLTARTDPPALKQPLRVVLDSLARIPDGAELIASAGTNPVALFHNHDVDRVHDGVRRFRVAPHALGGLDLTEVIKQLQLHFGVVSIMIEAGPRIAGSFLRADLVDKITWFRAPILIGGDGLSVVSSLGVDALNDRFKFNMTAIQRVGSDLVETYTRV